MKTYPTNLSLNASIEKRRSTVSFSKEAIEPQKIHLLFEAARWAPSSFNEQPWRFIYGTNDDPVNFGLLFELLLEGNKEWVKHAPMIILSVAKLDFTPSMNPNFYALHDVGLATQNLMIQAVHMGLMAHPIGGFDKKKAVTDLVLPEGFQPVAMIAVGYSGEFKDLPEALQKREASERIRKPQSDFVFRGKWR